MAHTFARWTSRNPIIPVFFYSLLPNNLTLLSDSSMRPYLQKKLNVYINKNNVYKILKKTYKSYKFVFLIFRIVIRSQAFPITRLRPLTNLQAVGSSACQQKCLPPQRGRIGVPGHPVQEGRRNGSTRGDGRMHLPCGAQKWKQIVGNAGLLGGLARWPGSVHGGNNLLFWQVPAENTTWKNQTWNWVALHLAI